MSSEVLKPEGTSSEKVKPKEISDKEDKTKKVSEKEDESPTKEEKEANYLRRNNKRSNIWKGIKYGLLSAICGLLLASTILLGIAGVLSGILMFFATLCSFVILSSEATIDIKKSFEDSIKLKTAENKAAAQKLEKEIKREKNKDLEEDKTEEKEKEEKSKKKYKKENKTEKQNKGKKFSQKIKDSIAKAVASVKQAKEEKIKAAHGAKSTEKENPFKNLGDDLLFL